jgi:Ca2+-binding RTX toxin-like protein
MASMMSEDVIEFTDLTSSDVTLAIVGSNVVLTTSTGDSITIKPFNPSPMGFMDYPIATIKFSDGEIWSHSNMAANAITAGTEGNDYIVAQDTGATIDGKGGNDNITGGMMNDTIIGGTGDDILDGGMGADTYKFSQGFGHDTIVDNMASMMSEDVIEFTDLTSSDVTLAIVGSDVLLTAISGDTITIKPFNPSPMGFSDYPISQIKFSDGEIWSHSDMAANAITAGTEGADNIVGQDTGAIIDGKGGNDTITGGMGSDIIIGGTGDDTLDGGMTSDTYRFSQGFGHDTIVDNMASMMSEDVIEFTDLTSSDVTLAIVGSNVVLTTSTGDSITIKPFNPSPMGFMDYPIATIKFSDGEIWSHSNMAANAITAGTEGNDYIVAQDTGATIDGKGGNDNITGGMMNDTIIGGTGDDILDGGMGADTYKFSQGFGHDTIVDNMASMMSEDVIEFTDLTSSDVTLAIVGSDVLLTAISGDTITIKPFNPSPMGFSDYPISQIKFSDGEIWNHNAMAANVVTTGTEGNDVITGMMDTASTIDGKGGNDTITGGMMNDIINGGLGNDTLTGDMGMDTFVFNTAVDSTNNKYTITDFAEFEDKISLDNGIFNQLVDEGVLSSVNFSANATGTASDANDYVLYNTSTGALLYDADGNGQGVAVEFVVLTNKPQIDANNVVIASV